MSVRRSAGLQVGTLGAQNSSFNFMISRTLHEVSSSPFFTVNLGILADSHSAYACDQLNGLLACASPTPRGRFPYVEAHQAELVELQLRVACCIVGRDSD